MSKNAKMLQNILGYISIYKQEETKVCLRPGVNSEIIAAWAKYITNISAKDTSESQNEVTEFLKSQKSEKYPEFREAQKSKNS